MSKPKLTVEEWLDWAQDKYDAAQERYAWGSGSESTMDSYSTLVSALEYSMARRSEERASRVPAVNKEYDGFRAWCCQACGHVFGDEGEVTNYCPEGGADMVMEP